MLKDKRFEMTQGYFSMEQGKGTIFKHVWGILYIYLYIFLCNTFIEKWRIQYFDNNKIANRLFL